MGSKGWGSAKRTEYGGVLYASKTEAVYAAYLDREVKAKRIRWWDRQVKLPLIVNDVKVCQMLVDFRVCLKDGSCEYRETKGFVAPAFRLKLKLLRALHPEISYVVIPAREALAL